MDFFLLFYCVTIKILHVTFLSILEKFLKISMEFTDTSKPLFGNSLKGQTIFSIWWSGLMIIPFTDTSGTFDLNISLPSGNETYDQYIFPLKDIMGSYAIGSLSQPSEIHATLHGDPARSILFYYRALSNYVQLYRISFWISKTMLTGID